MNCKNCNDPLEIDAHFCDNCGARVITNRITFRFLISELLAMLGFDSLFFRTLKKMLTTPHHVLNEYLSGVRKKYVNPFAYLAVGAALSLILFNFFIDDFVEANKTINNKQITELEAVANKDLSTIKNISEKELLKLQNQQKAAKFQLKFLDFWVKSIIKYFNIIAFIFLPTYAFMSKWVYRKPHNFGEHIVINAYLQGTTMYFSIIMFLLSILIHPKVYVYSMILYVIYYSYTFTKLYNHTLKQQILKLLRFIIVLLVTFILIMILTAIVSFLTIVILKSFKPELLQNLLSP